ncbi:MAG: DUF1844 domain-containing protein [Nitrospiria bacterium]
MEDGSSFVIRDRRAGVSDEKSEPAVSQKNDSQTPPENTAEKPKGDIGTSEKASGQQVPVNFSSFILSLATSALIHLGEEADPSTGRKSVDILNAKQAIDLISLLEEKTTGNLSPEEENLISQLLYTLRMKFVSLEKATASKSRTS